MIRAMIRFVLPLLAAAAFARTPAELAADPAVRAGAHSLSETFDATDSWRGTQRALLLAIALAR